MDVARNVPLMATSSLVVARATDAVPKPPNTVAATSVAVVSVRTERIRCSSTGMNRQCLQQFFGTGSGVLADENNTGAGDREPIEPNGSGHDSGSNFEISQEPLTFVNVTRAALAVVCGSGFSLLVAVWLMNTSTTAESGCNSETAARTTLAVSVTRFCCARAAICSVNLM